MESSANWTFVFWMLLVLLVLALILAPFVLTGRTLKKFQRAMLLISTPPPIVEAPIKTEYYDIPQVKIAVQIIQSWFPHEETELIESAPTRLWGALNKTLRYREGHAELEFDLYYDVQLELQDVPITLRKANGQLVVELNETQGVGIKLSYRWTGAEAALSDLFCIDYKVLHYMIDRVQSEFLALNYHNVDSLEKEPQLAMPPRQTKQWGRTFTALPGERAYSYWPNPQDYSESVQLPTQNFMDDGIKGCQPVLNEIGIPRVASGMFASVYQFRNEHEQWAVRCFTTRLKDQQERYKAISSFILADDLPYTVDFHYLEDGIKCGDLWFPILKMTWVEGQSLESYVRENLRNFAALQRLRAEFATMMEKLKANGVAHGDLQHGNILISSEQIFLVDYDGFYVPELAGRHNNELGHPNYQHPKRSEKYFGPYLDNFSAHVIDTSLLCLIEDPFLWQNFNGGDECLLFRRKDFVAPDQSKLFKTLLSHDSTRIRVAAQNLLNYINLPIEDIPYLQSEKPDPGESIPISNQGGSEPGEKVLINEPVGSEPGSAGVPPASN